MTSARAGKTLVSATIVVSTPARNRDWSNEGRPKLVSERRRRREGSGLGQDFVIRRRSPNRYCWSDEVVWRRTIDVEVRRAKIVEKIFVGFVELEPWFDFGLSFFDFFEFELEKWRKPFS
jgi:hypothetical protein